MEQGLRFGRPLPPDLELGLARVVGRLAFGAVILLSASQSRGQEGLRIGKIEVHSALLDAVLRDKPQIKEDE